MLPCAPAFVFWVPLAYHTYRYWKGSDLIKYCILFYPVVVSYKDHFELGKVIRIGVATFLKQLLNQEVGAGGNNFLVIYSL